MLLVDYTGYTAQAAKHRQTLHTKRLAGTCAAQLLLASHPHANNTIKLIITLQCYTQSSQCDSQDALTLRRPPGLSSLTLFVGKSRQCLDGAPTTLKYTNM